MTECLPLHEAIKSAMLGRASTHSAAKVLGVAQPTVHRWTTGEVEPRVSDLVRLAQACDRPRWFIFEAAGLSPPTKQRTATVPEAIRADPDLDKVARAALLACYHGLTHDCENP